MASAGAGIGSTSCDSPKPMASTTTLPDGKRKTARVEREVRRLSESMTTSNDAERQALQKKLEETQERMPAPLPALFSVSNDAEKQSPIHILARGEYQKKGDRVGMRPLGVLVPEEMPEQPPSASDPRTSLAKWIVDPD